MKMLTILILVLLLTGCPGMGNRASIQRGVFTHRDVVCFSVNKKMYLTFTSYITGLKKSIRLLKLIAVLAYLTLTRASQLSLNMAINICSVMV